MKEVASDFMFKYEMHFSFAKSEVTKCCPLETWVFARYSWSLPQFTGLVLGHSELISSQFIPCSDCSFEHFLLSCSRLPRVSCFC